MVVISGITRGVLKMNTIPQKDGKQYSAENIHAHALTSLHDEFATVLPTDKVIRALAVIAV
jgi:hypothetical protein